MRFVALLVLMVGCTYDYWPAPRGPRTACSGMIVGQTYGYQAASWGNSTCETYPADRCNPSNETYDDDVADGTCAELEADRRKHNHEVAGREHRDHVVAGVLGVLVGSVLVIGLVTQ